MADRHRTAPTPPVPPRRCPRKPGRSPRRRPGRSPRPPASPTGDQPSFGKELFLGRFRLDLIDPWPRSDPDDVARARGVPRPARAPSSRSEVDGAADRAGRAHPRRGVPRPGRPRRVRHEDRPEVRRARAVQPALLPGADAGRLGQPGHRRAALGAPVDRRAAAAEDVRHRRAEADASCPGSPPARCPRSCSPSRTSAPTRPGWRTIAEPTEDGTGYRLNGVKLWATNGTVATLLVVMARVPASRGAPGRHHRVRGGGRQRRASPSSGATSSSACAAWRTA